jgi:hypothetical protein
MEKNVKNVAVANSARKNVTDGARQFRVISSGASGSNSEKNTKGETQMKNQKKREIMLQAYKLLEEFEQPTSDSEYWEKLYFACVNFCATWTGVLNEYATRISLAIYESLEAEWKLQAPHN